MKVAGWRGVCLKELIRSTLHSVCWRRPLSLMFVCCQSLTTGWSLTQISIGSFKKGLSLNQYDLSEVLTFFLPLSSVVPCKQEDSPVFCFFWFHLLLLRVLCVYSSMFSLLTVSIKTSETVVTGFSALCMVFLCLSGFLNSYFEMFVFCIDCNVICLLWDPSFSTLIQRFVI